MVRPLFQEALSRGISLDRATDPHRGDRSASGVRHATACFSAPSLARSTCTWPCWLQSHYRCRAGPWEDQIGGIAACPLSGGRLQVAAICSGGGCEAKKPVYGGERHVRLGSRKRVFLPFIKLPGCRECAPANGYAAPNLIYSVPSLSHLADRQRHGLLNPVINKQVKGRAVTSAGASGGADA